MADSCCRRISRSDEEYHTKYQRHMNYTWSYECRIMNNVSIYSQNISKDDQSTKTIMIGCYAFYGLLGTVLNFTLMCYQLRGFKKRKPYEYILFATTLVDLVNSVDRGTLYMYAMTQHEECVCAFCGMLTVTLSCATLLLLTVNMLHRYWSLHKPALTKKMMTTRGIVICTGLPILFNFACFTPLLLFDVFGFDAAGSCSMKANRIWIWLSGAETFSCNFTNSILGFLIIRKLRVHVGQVQIFKSKVVQESKQIVELTFILTVWPLIPVACAFIIRLLPPESIFFKWVSIILILLIPSMIAVVPIVTIIIIKDYKASFIRFFKKVVNISVVEPIELKTTTETREAKP